MFKLIIIFIMWNSIVNFFLKLGWYTNHYDLMKPLYTFVDVDNKICTVSFPIDDDVKAKDIVLDLDKNNLRIGIKTGNDDDDNGVLFFIKDEVFSIGVTHPFILNLLIL